MNDNTKDKIVVTGLGCVTAAGPDLESTWQAVKDKKTGIDKITLWDPCDSPYQLAGEIKDFNPRRMISDRKLLRFLSKQDVIGLNAVEQVIEHSGLILYRDQLSDPTEFNERMGMYVGSPGNKFAQQYDFLPLFTHSKGDTKKFAEELFEQVHPMWLLRILPNNVLAYIGINYGFKGPNQNIANHGISGTQAIIEALHDLRAGVIDRAIVVGYEYACDLHNMKYYESMGLLSPTGLNAFDERHDGTILAEGAGALVLETEKAAQERGAVIYGEMQGGMTASEAHGILSVRDDGEGVERAMHNTLQHYNIEKHDLGMIVAHANATQQSDLSESNAIGNYFGDQTVPVTGFKWALGHTLSAAGVIEAVLTIKALEEKIIPGLAPLKKKAYNCQRLSLDNEHRDLKGTHALLISRAFSSLNACLLLSAFSDTIG